MKIFKKIKKGFTLVELVVVIAIIAILSGVSVAVYVGITENAKQSAANQEASTIGRVVYAAVLMDAQGYKFLKNGGVYTSGDDYYLAKWDSAKGIVFEAKGAYATEGDPEGKTWAATEDINLIKFIFMAAEKKTTFTGTLFETSVAADKVNHELLSFTFTPEGNTKSGTYKFIG